MRERARYGVDAPGVLARLCLGGSAGLLAGLAALTLAPPPWRYVGWLLVVAASIPAGLGVLMAAYTLVGKRRTRAHLLEHIRWGGGERVLDVGTGAGFLLVEAARRAPGGFVTGIDLWSPGDLSGNGPDRPRENAILEGVADRVEVLTGDARDLPFPDGAFDAVVSLLCLHNIEGAAGQAQACREIARVLRPGGRVVIGDYVPTHAYARAFAAAGLRVRQSRSALGVALSLMWILVADKPA